MSNFPKCDCLQRGRKQINKHGGGGKAATVKAKVQRLCHSQLLQSINFGSSHLGSYSKLTRYNTKRSFMLKGVNEINGMAKEFLTIEETNQKK